MRRLENEEDDKFWEGWIKDDLIFCYRFGKIGASGHIKIKKFKTRAEAEAELEARWKEKLGEGFSEPGKADEAEAEDDENEDEDDEAEAEDGENEDEDDEAEAEDGENEDEDDGDEDEDDENEDEDDGDEDEDGENEDEDDGDEDEDGENEDEDDEDEDEDGENEDEDDGDEDEDGENEDEDDGDEDEDDEDEDAPKRVKRANRAPAPAPPAPPEKPKLPTRVHRRTPTTNDLVHARTALEALVRSAGGRSWHVRRRANAAGRAVEKLGGADPSSLVETAKAWDALVAQVMAPAKALPLHAALRVFAGADATVISKAVGFWRAKMLSTPAAAAIGVLAATFEAVPDAEVAAQTSAALVDRVLPREGFRRRFAKVRPFLEESLQTKGKTLPEFLASLRPATDVLLQRRLADAKEVAGASPALEQSKPERGRGAP
jgi:predicted DNA-binding WGR domain protein